MAEVITINEINTGRTYKMDIGQALSGTTRFDMIKTISES
jgi:hypothetical protein